MSPLLMRLAIGKSNGNGLFQFFTSESDMNPIVNPTVFNSVVLVLVLCVFFIICGNAVKKADPSKPSKGIVLFLEILVTSIEGLVEQTMGAKHLNFAPFIGTLTAYLICANLLGLLGLSAPTSDYNVTLALAVITITVMVGSGIKARGIGGYLYEAYLGDFPFLLPLNITGELAKPISLSFRLFGNILSGGIIMSLVYQALGWFSPLIAPFLHGYFDIFSGVIQTLIFIMLTMIWSQGAMD
ncbi:MAG: F0F1 ATP synthase subunit A [Turicibacter sp.]|nr:F0F1 ATP synthase subunit A [Turicibacter sp.]